MTERGQDTAQGGFALFVVLMFLMLAAAIATPFFSTARDYALILRNGTQASRERTVSDGLLALSAQRYFELAGRQERLPAQVSCAVGDNGETLFVSFQNHVGLIDLNAASSQLLRLGFVALGVDASAAQQLAAAVESYRSPDPGARPAESGAPIFGGLKKAPFESPAELLDFRLPASVDAEALASVFTVHARLDGIIEGFVSPRLAKALGAAAPGRTPPQGDAATPTPAVTVDLYFAMNTGRRIHSRATYLPLDGATVKRHGPAIRLRGDAAPEIAANQPPPVDCADFYDERSLPVLVGLLN